MLFHPIVSHPPPLWRWLLVVAWQVVEIRENVAMGRVDVNATAVLQAAAKVATPPTYPSPI